MSRAWSAREHVDQERLHEARRHVHQQPVAGDVAERDGLQVEADRLQGPALDHGTGLRLKGVPEVPDEVQETAPVGLLPAKLLEVTLDGEAFFAFLAAAQFLV
jgi:hypothetical protein